MSEPRRILSPAIEGLEMGRESNDGRTSVVWFVKKVSLTVIGSNNTSNPVNG